MIVQALTKLPTSSYKLYAHEYPAGLDGSVMSIHTQGIINSYFPDELCIVVSYPGSPLRMGEYLIANNIEEFGIIRFMHPWCGSCWII